jgi:hypothetical protein
VLKPYNELVKVDVKEHCDTRKAKDDNGKSVDIPYLNWAKCKNLLHEHGAETVYFTPISNADGGFVFCSKEVQNKDGRKCGCYFVAVEIVIDDKQFRMDMPLLNGSLVVYEDTLNQLRISNCHARAFVKGVAIHTGLGFSLWSNDNDTDTAPDDLSIHNIQAIKTRIEQLMTAKLSNGLEYEDMLKGLGISKKNLEATLKACDNVAWLENKLKAL